MNPQMMDQEGSSNDDETGEEVGKFQKKNHKLSQFLFRISWNSVILRHKNFDEIVSENSWIVYFWNLHELLNFCWTKYAEARE